MEQNSMRNKPNVISGRAIHPDSFEHILYIIYSVIYHARRKITKPVSESVYIPSTADNANQRIYV